MIIGITCPSLCQIAVLSDEIGVAIVCGQLSLGEYVGGMGGWPELGGVTGFTGVMLIGAVSLQLGRALECLDVRDSRGLLLHSPRSASTSCRHSQPLVSTVEPGRLRGRVLRETRAQTPNASLEDRSVLHRLRSPARHPQGTQLPPQIGEARRFGAHRQRSPGSMRFESASSASLLSSSQSQQPRCLYLSHLVALAAAEV
jgi:hypothetical protein